MTLAYGYRLLYNTIPIPYIFKNKVQNCWVFTQIHHRPFIWMFCKDRDRMNGARGNECFSAGNIWFKGGCFVSLAALIGLDVACSSRLHNFSVDKRKQTACLNINANLALSRFIFFIKLELTKKIFFQFWLHMWCLFELSVFNKNILQCLWSSYVRNVVGISMVVSFWKLNYILLRVNKFDIPYIGWH